MLRSCLRVRNEFEPSDNSDKDRKNREYHERIKCSPHEVIFDFPLKMGIGTSALPTDMIG